jgi:hypothetical protein
MNELPARVYRIDMTTGRRDLVRELMPPDPGGTGNFLCASISPDGKTLVFFHSSALERLYLAEGLR